MIVEVVINFEYDGEVKPLLISKIDTGDGDENNDITPLLVRSIYYKIQETIKEHITYTVKYNCK